MLLGGVAGGVYQPQHESSASTSPITTPPNTTAGIACSFQVTLKFSSMLKLQTTFNLKTVMSTITS